MCMRACALTPMLYVPSALVLLRRVNFLPPTVQISLLVLAQAVKSEITYYRRADHGRS